MARSSHHPTPLVCAQTFIIAVFPVLIYVCQWFGKVSSAAGCLSGMLLVLKVMVELRHARQQQKPLRLAHQRRHTTQHMVAGCYFCGYMRVLRPSILEGMRVGVCQKCAASLRLSRRGREHYGCVLLRLGAAADVQHKRCMISLLLRHMVAPIINAGLIEEPCSGLL